VTNVQMGFGRTIQSGSKQSGLTRIAVTEGPMSDVLLEEAGVAG